jgi:hypothetical protein
MVSLDQVKLLETKVAKAIEYAEQVTGENAALQEKLGACQKRIDGLEVLVQRFKEDQGRIEDGILAALDRLNQFEDAIEKSLDARDKQGSGKKTGKAPAPKAEPEAETIIPESAEINAAEGAGGFSNVDAGLASAADLAADGGEEAADIEDPLKETGKKRPENGELDIF